MQQEKFRLDILRNFLKVGVTKQWKVLPRGDIQSLLWEFFMFRLPVLRNVVDISMLHWDSK